MCASQAKPRDSGNDQKGEESISAALADYARLRKSLTEHLQFLDKSKPLFCFEISASLTSRTPRTALYPVNCWLRYHLGKQKDYMNAVIDLESCDIVKIFDCIPHRYPFLLVDMIVSMNGEDQCIGRKNVSINEPCFQGHFSGSPIFPGTLIVEGMAQTAGIACAASKRAQGLTPKVIYMLSVENAKFWIPVRPSDVVEYHLTKLAYRRNIWRYRGEARVHDELVAEAEIGVYCEFG